MSRVGITQLDVYEACKKLLAKDQKITIQGVRSELGGSGSYTTISNYIKLFKEESKGKDLSKAGLSKSIRQLIDQLATQLDAEASDSIISIEEKFDEERKAFEAELTSLKEQLASKTSKNNSLKLELDQLKDKLSIQVEDAAQLAKTLQHKDLEISRLTGVVYTKEEAVNRLEQSIKQSFNNLEDFRLKSKEVTEELKRGHQEEIQRKDIENRKLAITVSTLQQEVTQLNRQNAELITEKRAITKIQHDQSVQLKDLQKELQKALNDNAELSGAIKGKDKEIDRANLQLEDCRKVNDKLKMKLNQQSKKTKKQNRGD